MDTQLAAINLGERFFGSAGHPLAQESGVSGLVTALVSDGLVVAGVILIIMIIYAGSSMINAAGNPQEFQRAQGILTSAIVGFVIVVAAWFITKAVELSTGVNILQ